MVRRGQVIGLILAGGLFGSACLDLVPIRDPVPPTTTIPRRTTDPLQGLDPGQVSDEGAIPEGCRMWILGAATPEGPTSVQIIRVRDGKMVLEIPAGQPVVVEDPSICD